MYNMNEHLGEKYISGIHGTLFMTLIKKKITYVNQNLVIYL